MKITIQKQTTVTEEIEVEFPVFLKYGSKLIKVLSETACIAINEDIEPARNMINYALEVHKGYDGLISLYFKEGTPITEEAFIEAYNKNMDGMLNFQFSEMGDATETEKREAAEDEGREEAEIYKNE